MINTPQTKLDAVNALLLSIGEQKVNTLESSGVLEVDIAKSTFDEVSRSIQARGWHFNTDYNFTLYPDDEGHINLPGNCIRARAAKGNNLDVVQRGTRLYDRKNHSYIFDKEVGLDIVTYLNFDELTEPARRAITARAGRRFQQRTLGSQVTEQFTEEEEKAAMKDLEAADNEDADLNILTDNYPNIMTVGRDSW